MKNKILYKITRALYLSLYVDDEDFHKNYELMTKHIEPFNITLKSLYLFNQKIQNNEQIVLNDFIKLYNSDDFFGTIRKESLSEESQFNLKKLFSIRDEKHLFEYINDNYIFGHLSFVMSVLFVNQIRKNKRKKMLIFYGYQEINYRISKNFDELILEASENTKELTIRKKQYSLYEIKKEIEKLDCSFIPKYINYGIYLFGSYATQKNDITSDIDIAIVYEGYNKYIDLIEKTFSEFLKEKFVFVDIVSICINDTLSPFEKRVMKTGIKLR